MRTGACIPPPHPLHPIITHYYTHPTHRHTDHTHVPSPLSKLITCQIKGNWEILIRSWRSAGSQRVNLDGTVLISHVINSVWKWRKSCEAVKAWSKAPRVRAMAEKPVFRLWWEWEWYRLTQNDILRMTETVDSSYICLCVCVSWFVLCTISGTDLARNTSEAEFLNFKEPKNRFQGTYSARLCTCVAWRAGTTTLFILGSQPP